MPMRKETKTQRKPAGTRCASGGPRSAAFTLAELLVVLTILALLAAMAVPRYTLAAGRHRLDAAAQRLAADLELARERATMTSAAVDVVFDPATDSYKIAALADPAHPERRYVVRLAAEPYQCELLTAAAGPDLTLTFNGFGHPETAAVIELRAGSATRKVLVDGDTGEVRIDEQ